MPPTPRTRAEAEKMLHEKMELVYSMLRRLQDEFPHAEPTFVFRAPGNDSASFIVSLSSDFDDTVQFMQQTAARLKTDSKTEFIN